MEYDNTVTEKERNFYLIYHTVRNGFSRKEKILLSATEEKNAIEEVKLMLKKVRGYEGDDEVYGNDFRVYDHDCTPYIYIEDKTIIKYCIDLTSEENYKTLKNAEQGELFFNGNSVQRLVTKKPGITTHTLGDGLSSEITSEQALRDYFGK